MSSKRVVLVLGVLALGAALFLAGTAFAQSAWGSRLLQGTDDTPYGWGPGHMNDYMDGWDEEDIRMHDRFGSMMGSGMMGFGAEGEFDECTAHRGMMGGWGGLTDVEPLSVEDAEHAVSEFIGELDEDNLAVGEIMIFENHAYGQVIDSASGEGAFEVLVDPVTGNVYPEPGPNMMWNTEYGRMGGGMMGMMSGGFRGERFGGMMDGYGPFGGDPDAAATVDETEAVEQAEAYLDEFLPGATADDHADTFPGYYTLHVLRDGEIVGMLSVNAFSGDVFPHTWHGDFITMSGNHSD